METKRTFSFRLTAEAKRLLRELAQHFGIRETAVLELAIREKAQRAKIS
jgi:predicted transcriptional regulator